MNSTTTQTTTLSNLQENLLSSIEQKDKDKTLSFISELIELTMKDTEVVTWITTPEVITALHESLSVAYNIPVQNFRLRGKQTSKGKRAYLFAKMMEIGLKSNDS